MYFTSNGMNRPCYLEVGWYDKTDNLFIDVIEMTDDGDSEFAALTALPKNEVLPYGYGYLNPLFPNGEKFIEENELGEPTGNQITVGCMIYKEYDFNLEILGMAP